MDWFTNLGVLARMLPTSPALAFDIATSPGLDVEKHGFDMGYYMQNMPETVSPYPNNGPFTGA